MIRNLSERLTRIEVSRRRMPDAPPPGMVPTLMFGVAVRLGGYPRLEDGDPSRGACAVSDGLARGLGYADFGAMDDAATADVDVFGERLNEAFAEVLRTEGVEPDATDDAEVLGAFVRILDEPGAVRAVAKPDAAWGDVGRHLDAWIRACGLSPEAVRAVARS